MNPDDEVHQVDGIVELNHPAPMWWQAIFYISIVWGVGYGWYYLFGGGPTLKEELAANLQQIETQRLSQSKTGGGDEQDRLRAYFKDSNHMNQGRVAFQKTCASCHAADGGGGIGPNLTDKNWIHGDGSIDAIYKVVVEGVAEKGMPPWGPVLKPEELLEIAAYVRSLRGHKTAQPKAPQGPELVETNDI